MKRILCLKFPGWPLQRLVAARPELRQSLSTQAIVIHLRDPRRGDLVRLCSAQAWRCGVRPGMPLAEATALFPRESEVFFSAHDPATDLKLLARIATWCERYSPLVGWETVGGGRKELLQALPPSPEPEALFLDITGIGALFGGERELAAELLGEVSRRGFVARVGVAETIGAAWAAAEGQAEERRSGGAGERQPDNISSASLLPCSPAGIVVISRDQLGRALAPLPITALRLADDHVATLHELGVKTIGELALLPPKGLSSRFGPGLLLRIEQALGSATELIQPHRPLPAFQAEWLLEHPTQRREEVELILEQLVERVAGQLFQRQAGATRLSCRLDIAGHRPLGFQIGLYRATASPKHLLELVLMQLERLRLPGAVGRIGLAAVLTAPLETHQGHLFDDVSLRTARAQALLLDRLSSRLGGEAVLRPLLVSDALPERSVKLVAATANKSRRAGGQGSRRAKQIRNPKSKIPNLKSEIRNLNSPAPSHRPLLLLSPPQEIATTAIAPDGPPVRLCYEQRQEQVARHWGPERIETSWWRGRSIRRDYYRVETTSGLRFWLFRELHEGRWFLHGVFE